MAHDEKGPSGDEPSRDVPFDPDHRLITYMDAGEPPFERGFFRSLFMPKDLKRSRGGDQRRA